MALTLSDVDKKYLTRCEKYGYDPANPISKAVLPREVVVKATKIISPRLVRGKFHRACMSYSYEPLCSN